MGLLAWIIVGALAGWVASMIMKRDASMGAIANIIVGIVGALIGGFVVNLLAEGEPAGGITGFNIQSFLVALLGAVVLLAIINLVRRGSVR